MEVLRKHPQRESQDDPDRGGLPDLLDRHVRLPGQAQAQRPAALVYQRRLARIRSVAPVLAAALATWLGGASIGDAILVALAVAVTMVGARTIGFPFHLMAATRLGIAFLAPALGVGLIVAAGGLGSNIEPELSGAWLPVLAAALVALVADAFEIRMGAWVPMRIGVVGSPAFAAGLERELVEVGLSRVTLVGWIDLSGAPSNDADNRWLADRLKQIVETHGIDVIVQSMAGSEEDQPTYETERVAEACLGLRVRVIEGNLMYEELFGHVPMGTIDSAWFRFIVHPRFRPPSSFARRALDLLIAAPLLVLVGPVIVAAIAAIRIEGGGPAFYRQIRVGEKGKEFEILKLRTMRADAEVDGPQLSVGGDARVTGVGKILRRLHVDELPQLANVLRGEMTLVGPRPERPELVERIEQTFSHYQRRHLVTPGVTGWAQVRCGYAGSTLGTAWKLCHDLYYLKHRSLLGDLAIMFETVAIAARDSHRPLRVPESQFVFGRELGIDISLDQAGGRPEPDQAEPRIEHEPEAVRA